MFCYISNYINYINALGEENTTLTTLNLVNYQKLSMFRFSLKIIIFSILLGVIRVECLIFRMFLLRLNVFTQVILTVNSWKLESLGLKGRAEELQGKRWLHRSSFIPQSFQKHSCISQKSATVKWLNRAQREKANRAVRCLLFWTYKIGWSWWVLCLSKTTRIHSSRNVKCKCR